MGYISVPIYYENKRVKCNLHVTDRKHCNLLNEDTALLLNIWVNEMIEDVKSKSNLWLNLLAVVLKGENDVRLFLDIHNENTAIERICFSMARVEELIVKLRNANWFSKLDLDNAFHQLELDPESRYITVFQTEDCIQRYINDFY